MNLMTCKRCRLIIVPNGITPADVAEAIVEHAKVCTGGNPMIPEPAEHTFAVWFHPTGVPVLTFYRADACTWEGQHWRVAHLDGRTDDPQPQTWAEVCELGRKLRLDGPHLLVREAR